VNFLRNTKVQALFPKERIKLVTAYTSDSVSDVLQRLSEHSILSMPVYDSRIAMYTTFVDMLDITYYIVETIQENQITGGEFSALLKTSEKFTKKTCAQIAGTSGRNPYYPIEEHTPLQTAMELMVDYRVHRLPVVDTAGHLQTIVSQSHIVDLLLKHMDKFSIGSQRISKLKLGLKEVLKVDKRQKAIEAFKLIYQNRVAGVAVVDGNELVGNISASDIKLIGNGGQYLPRLFLPLEEFLKLIPKHNNSMTYPYRIDPEATVEQVLARISLTKCHRIYVCTDDNNLIGVISLQDIIEAVLNSLK